MGIISKTIGCLLLWAPLLLAASNLELTAKNLESQRKTFLEAERALSRGQLTKHRRLKASLKDYPLVPYLEYQMLTRRLGHLKNAEVATFLKAQAGTPLAGRLRSKWLDLMARRGNWQSFLEFYQYNGNNERSCRYLHALIKTGSKAEALQQVEPLWLHGRSQPKACDPVFDAWREAKLLTKDLVWQRVELAMDQRQLRLARYLGRYLPKEEQAWLDDWLAVYQNPKLVLQQKHFREEHPYRSKILLYGVKRLSRRDGFAALTSWNILNERYEFDAPQRLDAERTLAFALIRDKYPGTLAFLSQIQPAPEDSKLLEARLREGLKRKDWTKVLEWTLALPDHLGTSERWTYWQARALNTLGRKAEAETLYQKISRERTYYGFLAADQLGGDYRLEHIPLEIEDKILTQRIATLPGIERARELHALGRLVSARREWEAAIRDMVDSHLEVASKLAHSWDWLDRSIFSMARAGYWDDLELRFPLKHRKHVENHAGSQKLEIAWVFAVMRQESAFIADARSRAGALGLMQLMPATARQVLRKLPHKPKGPLKSLLMQPYTNIKLGTTYRRQVLNELYEHPVLATAAYNAGPHRVRRWLPEDDTPADLWVETVPFTETRTYLRRVLSYTVIYEQRLGLKPTRLRDRMQPIRSASNIAKSEVKDGSDQG
jgi:soluble lytic murein transglycosylase